MNNISYETHLKILELYRGGMSIKSIAYQLQGEGVGVKNVIQRIYTEDIPIREEDARVAARHGFIPIIPTDETNQMQEYWRRTNSGRNTKSDGRFNARRFPRKD